MEQNMDKCNSKVRLFLSFVVLSVVSKTACVEVFTYTTTMSVRPGTNRLSCFPLEKANELGIKVFHASWQTRPGENHKWRWLGGVSDPNNLAEIRIPNGTEARYILYGANATLEIRNVTKGDNDAEYMCTGRGERGFRESLIKKISVFEPDQSTPQNCTCPETCNNCTCSTCNNTEASGAAIETTTAQNCTCPETCNNCTRSTCNNTEASGAAKETATAQNCTCPETCNNCTRSTCNNTEASGATKETTTDKSGTDGKCTAWIIGFVSLLLVWLGPYIIMFLKVAWEKIIPYCCTYQRNAFVNEPITIESRGEISASNGNVNCGEDCGKHESRELEGPYYGLPESNVDNEDYIIESVD